MASKPVARPEDGPEGDANDGTRPGRRTGYLALVKPRVLLLLALTGLASVMVADGGVEVVGWLLLGGVLATASANVFNNILDRDRDSLMERTMWRPLPTGMVGAGAAAAFGAVMGLLGLLVMYVKLNPLTAALTALGMLYYILVYTIVLKPRTSENITVGGVAGAFPPLVGWAAATGELALTPVLMGLMVILWTPPHFWSLALFYTDDYRRAGFPMLPVVRGSRTTTLRILAYTVLLVVVSLLLPFAGDVGWAYTVVAVVMAAPMLVLSYLLLTTGTEAMARRLFRFSNMYLAIMFVAMTVEPLTTLVA